MKNNYGLLRILVLIAFLFVVGTIPDDESCVFAQPTLVVKKPTKIATVTPKFKSTKDIYTLDEALKAGVPVVVKLGTNSCSPCRTMNLIIKELVVEQDGKAVFLSLDVYQNRELARQAGVRVIPTILFYDKHGKPKAKNEGVMTTEQLLQAIDELGSKK